MTRIIFVDDEVRILEGLQRMLRPQRNSWEMAFAPSGPAALQMMEAAPFDVIVSDMRMPGMDGWQLLAEVKKLYPQTVRLILSGHAEATSIMRAVGIAHQYLAKPCESAAIKDAIIQTQKLRHLLSNDRLAALVGQVSTLPSAPKAFQEVLACLQDPTASMRDVARIIGRDVAMTANIMKMVNSAFFGVRQPITTTDRAVAYLGLDTLGALVLGHGVFKSGLPTGIAGFSLEGLWAHSLHTAMAARTIALHEKFSSADAEKAFLAGVLHDVGKVVFATRTIQTSDIVASAEDDASRMQAHHAEVGAYLLGLWGFPNSIVEAVAYHHAPSLAADGELSLAGLVHIADYLVHRGSRTPGAIEPALEAGLLESPGLVERLAGWQAALEKFELENTGR
jgi:putative nucleotidyltransferase with HDIG domain